MSAENYTPDRGPTLWPFIAGLGLISLAPAVNFAFANMSFDDLDKLPPFITAPYEWAGLPGVTMVLVSLGLAVMAAGLFGQVMRARGPRPAATPDLGSDSSYNGNVTLDTTKYLHGQ